MAKVLGKADAAHSNVSHDSNNPAIFVCRSRNRPMGGALLDDVLDGVWSDHDPNPSQLRHPCDLQASLGVVSNCAWPWSGDGAQTQTKAAAIGLRPPTGEAHVLTLERPCGKGCQ